MIVEEERPNRPELKQISLKRQVTAVAVLGISTQCLLPSC